MKRAWPYAVALAIVVTGCYLALTPLLRSLSPGATPSSSSLHASPTSATVSQAKVINFAVEAAGKAPSQFASDLPATVKKAKKKAATPPTGNTTPSQTDTTTTGFACGSSSTQTPPKTAVKAKAKPVKRGSGSVNGTVDPGNGGGLAGSGRATAPRPAARTATRPATEHDAVERRRIAL